MSGNLLGESSGVGSLELGQMIKEEHQSQLDRSEDREVMTPSD